MKKVESGEAFVYFKKNLDQKDKKHKKYPNK